MLPTQDINKSLHFYRDVLGLTVIDKLDFPQYDFELYFLTSLPPGEDYTLEPGTPEAHKYLWSMNGVTIELTHNYGTEDQEDFKYHPGNQVH